MVHESSYEAHGSYYILFSVFFGAFAIFLTFLQYRVITKHLHARKYILLLYVYNLILILLRATNKSTFLSFII